MRVYLGLALVCFISQVYAQGYNFTNFSVDDGLAQSQVNDLAQDRFGNMWFATQGGGLSQFNGQKFTNFTKREGLASNIIYNIQIDHNNNIWSSHEKGISKYDGSSFTNITLDEKDKNVRPKHLHVANNGNLLFASPQGGLGIFEEDSLYYFGSREGFTDEWVTNIAGGENNLIYLSTLNDGLYTFDGVKFNKLPIGADKVILRIYYHAAEKQLWLIGKNGLYYLQDNKLHNITEEVPFPHPYFIRSITFDKKGYLWAATHKGAFKYHPQKGYTQFGSFEGFTNGLVSKVFTDREGLIWFATNGEGVFKYNDALFTYINKQHGMENEVVMSLIKDKNDHLWMATLGGLSRFDGKKVINYDQSTGIASKQLGGLATDSNGDVWICTANNGIYCYQQKEQVFAHYDFKSIGIPPSRIIKAHKDSKGNLWFTSNRGLIKFDGKQFDLSYLYSDQHPKGIWSFVELSSGVKLIGTEKGLQFMEGKELIPYRGIAELTSGIILTIAQHPSKSDEVYLGVMEEGIIRYNTETGETQKISMEDNLSSNLIYSLIFDNQENLLVGTERGIDRVSFHENGDILLVKNYNKADGFFGIETNQGAVFKEDDGSIWFGSIRGAFNFNPEEDKINLVQPITYFSGVKLFYEDIDWTQYTEEVSHWYSIPRNFELPYNQNHLIFEFMSSSLANQNRVRYQYKLEPFESSWSPVIDKNEAVYSNIPPGEYTFKVKSCNNDGIWNEEPSSLSFIIITPYWQTWWFITLVLITIILALRMLYIYRLRTKLARVYAIEQAKKTESEKTRRVVARDFQDELGNHLASISMFVQVLKAKVEPGGSDVNHILYKLEDYSKDLFSNAKDFVWSLDPNSDSLAETVLYIKDLGEEVFDKSKVVFIVDDNTLLAKDAHLPAGWSRQLVLMIKEAFTAYYKFNRPGTVKFSVSLTNNELRFILSEEGIGLSVETLKECQAYQNITKRATRIGHEIIQQKDGKSSYLIIVGNLP